MSELQIALLAIGLIVIIAVYSFGWWQQQQYKKKFGTSFRNDQHDPLYPEDMNEPNQTLPSELAPVVNDAIEAAVINLQPTIKTPAAASPTVTNNNEPIATEISATVTAETSTPPQKNEATPNNSKKSNLRSDHGQLLTEHSDFIIILTLKQPSPASVLEGFWQRKFDFEKATWVYGKLLQQDQEHKEKTDDHWERVQTETPGLFTQFKVALQMVDRAGAIHVAELSNFLDLLTGIAHKIDAQISNPEPHQAHQYAMALDAFCASVDQIIGINLMPADERRLPVRRIAEVASLQGITLESDGAFHFKNQHGRSVFSLINVDNSPFQHFTLENADTPGLTLLLDVPRTENPSEAFEQMVGLAQILARELQVNLVDDHLVVLSDAGLQHIANQIAEVEYKMQHSIIQAGSTQARRLFV